MTKKKKKSGNDKKMREREREKCSWNIEDKKITLKRE